MKRATCPRQSAAGRLMTVMMTVMTMLVAAACIGAYAPLAAAEESDKVTAPDSASQVWVDVEYTGDVTVEGTLNDEALDFASSPSGATAITTASAEESYTLALRASSDLDAFVAMTFVDSQDVVLQEVTTTTELGAERKTVTFEISSGSDDSDDDGSIGGSDSGDTGTTDTDDNTGSGTDAGNTTDNGGAAVDDATEEELSATGVAVTVIAAVAAVLCLGGVAMLVVRNRRYSAHAAGHIGVNGKEEM